MRKIVLFLCLVFVSTMLSAQSFLGAFSVGGNLSQVDGDEIYGYNRIGLNMGISAYFPIIPEKLFTSVEISYSQKGAYQKYPNTADPTRSLPYYSLRLNYLDVPFMVHWLDKRIIMAGTGFSYGRLIGMKEVEWGNTTFKQVLGSPYKTNDWTWLVEVRFPIKDRLKFSFRYNYSMFKLRTRTYTDDAQRTWSRNQFNNYLTFRLVYVFNEKIVKEVNE